MNDIDRLGEKMKSVLDILKHNMDLVSEMIDEVAALKKADEVDRPVIITLEITEMMYASIKHDCGIMQSSIDDGIRKVLIEEFGPE